MDLSALPEWGKFGFAGIVCGSLFTLLTIIILRVIPGMQKAADAKEERQRDMFKEELKVEREECQTRHEENMKAHQTTHQILTNRQAVEEDRRRGGERPEPPDRGRLR